MGILYKSDLDPSLTFGDDEAYLITLKKLSTKHVTYAHISHAEAKIMFFDKGYKPKWKQFNVDKKKYEDSE